MRGRICASVTSRNYGERISIERHGEPRCNADLHCFSDGHDEYSGDVECPGRSRGGNNHECGHLYSAFNCRNLSYYGHQPNRQRQERDGRRHRSSGFGCSFALGCNGRSRRDHQLHSECLGNDHQHVGDLERPRRLRGRHGVQRGPLYCASNRGHLSPCGHEPGRSYEKRRLHDHRSGGFRIREADV